MQDVDPLVNAAETYERPPYSYATEGKYNGFNPFFAGNMDAPGKGADWNWLSLYFSTMQSSLQSGNVVTSSKFTGATIYTLYLPNMIQGSVLFAGSGGLVTQDNTNFFWNASLLALKLGDGAYLQMGTKHPVYPNVVHEIQSLSYSFNGPVRLALQNTSAGGSAHSTIGVLSDEGNDSAFGIANSGWGGGTLVAGESFWIMNTGAGSGPGGRGMYLLNALNSYIRFGTNSSERARILSTGEWGINTTTPRKRLDVLDTAAQLRLTYTDNAVYTEFQTESTGQFVVTPTGNQTHVRNSTSAQTFSVYNTFTAGTPDYERLSLTWVSNVAQLQVYKSGTGTVRALELCVGGSTQGPTVVKVGVSANAGLILGCQTTSATPFTSGMVVVGNAIGHTATSSTTIGTLFNTGFSDGGTNSTTVAYLTQLAPTINYTGATRTGKVYLEYHNPTLTSLPTGRNTGLAFSSAFTTSGIMAMRFFNTTDEDTNSEWGEIGFGAVANVFGIRTNISGTGAVRNLNLYYCNSTTAALQIQNVGTQLDIATGSLTAAIAAGRLAIGRSGSITATSGTHAEVMLSNAGGPAPTATSTLSWRGLQISPTVNYSAGTPGAGKVNLLYLAPTLTAQPTGNNGGLVFSSAFTSSTFPEYLSYNTSDEDTNYERFECGWGIAANNYIMRTTKGGTGTARNFIIRCGGTATNGLLVGTSINGAVVIGASASTSTPISVGLLNLGNGGSFLATSSTNIGITLSSGASFSDGGTNSTTSVQGIAIAPTINYTGASRTGAIYGLYVNTTNTSLPTGVHAAIALSSTANALNGIVWNNQTDEQTNYENVKAFYTGNIWTLISAAGGTGTVRDMKFDPGTGDIIWGKALVALGGGAAATLGTIGGGGPAAAAQNTWMQIKDSAGNKFWVPAWK